MVKIRYNCEIYTYCIVVGLGLYMMKCVDELHYYVQDVMQ